MKRWFDKYPAIVRCIEDSKNMPKHLKERLGRLVLVLVTEHDPRMMHRLLTDRSINLRKRRWYDGEAIFRIAFDLLKYADKNLIEIVAEHIEKECFFQPQEQLLN